MPHVVIRGDVDLAAYARAFRPLRVRQGSDLLHAERVYLPSDARNLLVEALAVERGRKLSFYVKISRHDRGTVTVRIDPLTAVDRTPGVQRLVAEIGADLLARTPGSAVEVTNLVLPSRPLGDAEESDEGRR